MGYFRRRGIFQRQLLFSVALVRNGIILNIMQRSLFTLMFFFRNLSFFRVKILISILFQTNSFLTKPNL